MNPLNLFLAIGTFSLFWQTFADIKDKDLKDPYVFSKRSWLMMGVLLSLVLFTNFNFLIYLAALIGASLVFSLPSFRKNIGEGDIEALRWIVVGFIISDVFLLALFCFALALFTVVITVSRRFFKVDKEQLAYFPAIFGAFLLCDFVILFPFLEGVLSI